MSIIICNGNPRASCPANPGQSRFVNTDFHSIYKQIGPGQRIALSKIAVEHLERTGRPLRIAIDISIWQFQIQSGQGGKNPALRTLYYRLLRLLTLSIQPLFVFDGPHKPPFKRGRKVATGAACLPNCLTKELLKRFGFPYHTAPGEAEAECALLQKENLVDAVLSEDVDTIMFGCAVTMRSWTAEGQRGSKSPTHVNLYNAESTKKEKGLDSEGMILIALMSGGDYIPAGIPGCGIMTACAAAKAGFGRDLCQLSKDDIEGIRKWRERLEQELQTNESKFFQKKHKSIKIPENFPDKAVWGYYTHPAVSSTEKVARLRDEVKWGLQVNVTELRVFVADAFDWQYLSGAKKFVRGLAPALLPHQLIRRSKINATDNDDLEAKEIAEAKLVKSIGGQRNHWNTDGEPELRIAYIPIDVVGLDLEAEEKDDFQGYGLDASGDEQPASECDETRDRSKSPAKRRGPSTYDPAQIEKIWILETHVKLGVPLLVETWEEEMRNPKKFASRKTREKAKTMTFKGGIELGALDQYVKITKPGPDGRATKLPVKGKESTRLPPAFLAPRIVDMSTVQQRNVLAENTNPVGQKAQKQKEPSEAKATRTRKAPSASQTSTPPKDRGTNPWTLAKRTPEKPRFKSPPRDSPQELENLEKACSHIACFTASASTKKRHSRPTTPISDTEDPTGTTRGINGNVTLRRGKPSTPAKPSPRKKRSPLQMANDLYLAGQLRTPTLTPTGKQQDGIGMAENADLLNSQKVNRKLDFKETQATPPPASPVSISSSLPSPSTLLSPANPSDKESTGTEPPSKVQQPPTRTAGARRLVALRESLEGAWKCLEPWEVGARSSGRSVFNSVEVLDLTGG
ncbi:hypothetical protein HO173_002492 [Letharia columbiana]|uniref:XPG-I domain-containing protein n=1 Tax=Letharia columbiana TaxID=112416 RepID=A0A8H6L855_9LECA|nr:uncharacterized protein HO173_002492 [Letharia columbiana]KAF6239231.1 hypothetical protein HO173_002492 [Letharia columbiana]